MSQSSTKICRVQQAHDEVGITTIRPAAAAIFTAIFLFILSGVFITDHIVEWKNSSETNASLRSLHLAGEIPDLFSELRQQKFSTSAWVTANRKLLADIQQTEKEIDEQGAVASRMRPWSQSLLLRAGVGNEKVYPGKDRTLFYRPDVDSVSGPGFLDPAQLHKRASQATELEKAPQPDPVPALLDFKQQLATRGISLILVPTPVKPEIIPEEFTSRLNGLVQNESYPFFVQELSKNGIQVADVAGWLEEYKQQGRTPFLRTDTHWTPAAMQWIAARVADMASEKLSKNKNHSKGLSLKTLSVTNQGDIAAMLDLPQGQSFYPPGTVTIEQVITARGTPWKQNPEAEVLVLGDSFSTIYSLEGMGWGESAGFVEHLSYSLQQPVDRIVRNDQGAVATRRILARELARGRDRLAGKKVVLYQFANRELAQGDWQLIELELKKPMPSTFLALKPGEQIQVHGIVQEISPVPQPGSVPYRDHVVSLHLVDITTTEDPEHLAQAVVFMQSMTNNVWTPAARLRPGDEINLMLSSWNDFAGTKDGLNRSELDSLDLQLQEPVWGELLKE